MATDRPDPWVVFDYEVWMFRETVHLVRSGVLICLALPIRNAVVESMLLHTRIVVAILLSRDREADDIKLTELLPRFSSPGVDALRRAYGKRGSAGSPCYEINKKLAHATSIRSNHNDWSRVVDKLAPIIDSLISEIQSQRRDRS